MRFPERSSRGRARWGFHPALAILLAAGVAACSLDADSHESAEDPEELAPESVEDGAEGVTPESDPEETGATPGAEPAETTAGESAATGPAASSGAASQASATPEPAAPRASIGAGSVLTFEVAEEVSTRTHAPGDVFTLRLAEEVRGEGGAVLPAGAVAWGVVTEAAESPGSDQEAVLSVDVESVEADGWEWPLSGEVTSASAETSTRDSGTRTAAKVATGTAVGAVAGRILGGDRRSTAAGAAAGAAVGTGVALTTRDGHAILPEGAMVTYQLIDPLVLD